MKTLLIKTFLILLSSISIVPCQAQQTSIASFSYDANGNRIIRQIEIGGTKGDDNIRDCQAPAFVDDFETLSVTLYPNPTEGRFCITVNNVGDGKTLHAKLVTTSGNVIYDKTINNPTDCFDLTQHPAGIYLLELVVDNKSHIWKVIKR